MQTTLYQVDFIDFINGSSWICIYGIWMNTGSDDLIIFFCLLVIAQALSGYRSFLNPRGEMLWSDVFMWLTIVILTTTLTYFTLRPCHPQLGPWATRPAEAIRHVYWPPPITNSLKGITPLHLVSPLSTGSGDIHTYWLTARILRLYHNEPALGSQQGLQQQAQSLKTVPPFTTILQPLIIPDATIICTLQSSCLALKCIQWSFRIAAELTSRRTCIFLILLF